MSSEPSSDGVDEMMDEDDEDEDSVLNDEVCGAIAYSIHLGKTGAHLFVNLVLPPHCEQYDAEGEARIPRLLCIRRRFIIRPRYGGPPFLGRRTSLYVMSGCICRINLQPHQHPMRSQPNPMTLTKRSLLRTPKKLNCSMTSTQRTFSASVTLTMMLTCSSFNHAAHRRVWWGTRRRYNMYY